jgi:hypothetical protein
MMGESLAFSFVLVAAAWLGGADAGMLQHRYPFIGRDLGPSPSNATTHFFDGAIVNHFGSAPATWKQRYFVDDTFWCGDGCPILLLIGNEAPAGPITDYMFIYKLAAEHGALMVVLEHRFYGASMPAEDLSTANLKFLTSEQALADLAVFTQYLRSFDPADTDAQSSPPLNLTAKTSTSKVVIFGYSYGGTLTAWAKLKYPSLFAGAVSSSPSPHAEVNFEQYGEMMGMAFANPLVGGSAACLGKIKEGATALRELVTSTTPMGTDPSIPGLLRPCTPIASHDDLAAYETWLLWVFEEFVQENRCDMPCSLRNMCDAAMQGNQTAVEAFAATVALGVSGYFPGATCVPSSWQKFIAQASNTTADPADYKGMQSQRSWQWQKCNEFGWFHTSTGASNPFRAFATQTVEQLGLKRCTQEFGLSDTYTGPQVQWTNTNFGDRDLKAEDIVLLHGSMDPWHTLGLANASDPFFQSCTGSGPCPPQKLMPSAKLVFMENQSHVSDWIFWDMPDVFPNKPYVGCGGQAWGHHEIAVSVTGFLA